MLIFSGNDLKKHIEEEVDNNWNQRDYLGFLKNYISSNRKKVLGLSGLRGTGKTVGLLQLLKEYDGTYITAEKGEKNTSDEYISVLEQCPSNIIVIDEYPWISNKDDKRKDLDAYLYTLAQRGKKIIISGTNSIALENLRSGELIHRLDILQINNFSYDEFCRMHFLEKNKETCEKYLTTGGVFPEYVVSNYQSMLHYVKTAIIDSLSEYLPNMSPKYIAAIIYTILHKAVCNSIETTVPQLTEKRIPIENYLEEIGIDASIDIQPKDFSMVSSILKDAGIIVTVPNFKKKSEYRTYITNPGLTYQMILATHNISEDNPYMHSILGYIFEACCVVHAHDNLIGTGYGQDELFYLYKKKSGRECEIDFLIHCPSSKHSNAFLFECKLNDGPVVKERSSIVSSQLENILSDIDIAGRYVVYNGPHNYDVVNNKEILYVGMDNILANYHSFSANKATIMEELQGCCQKTYFEEREEKIVKE